MRRAIGAAAAAGLLVLAPLQAAAPVTAWVNGHWFDGTRFREVTVYSDGERLTLKRPAAISLTVDLGQRFITGAFAEAHNHNVPGIDAKASVRTNLDHGIFYVMIQANAPTARAQAAGLVNTPESIDVAFANGAFTAPGGHPTALVKRQISGGGMTSDDLDGGFLLPVASPADVASRWSEASSLSVRTSSRWCWSTQKTASRRFQCPPTAIDTGSIRHWRP